MDDKERNINQTRSSISSLASRVEEISDDDVRPSEVALHRDAELTTVPRLLDQTSITYSQQKSLASRDTSEHKSFILLGQNLQRGSVVESKTSRQYESLHKDTHIRCRHSNYQLRSSGTVAIRYDPKTERAWFAIRDAQPQLQDSRALACMVRHSAKSAD